MKKLNKYISKQILIGFLLVTFSLLSILWLTQSLRFVELITNKGLPLGLFIKMTSCLMPRLYALLSPIAIFVAILFVYNRMLSDRELVVIKSAGVTPWQSAKPALFMGIIISFLGLYVSNYAIPKSEEAFEDIEWQVKNNVSHLMFREGEFTTIKYGLTIFINSHQQNNTIEGVLINDERNPQKNITITAEHGFITYEGEEPKITLLNGIRQEINNKSKQFSSLSFDKYSLELGNMGSSKKSQTERSQSLKELLTAKSNPKLTPQEQNRYIVEGNKRLISPFYNLSMALLACLGLIIGNFNRRGQSKIIYTSILLMVVIQAGDISITNIAYKNPYFIALLYTNLIVPFAICLYILTIYKNPQANFFQNKKRHIK